MLKTNQNMTTKKLISFIVPAYNEELNIVNFYSEIKKVWKVLPSYEFELIFVNDGSKDCTTDEILKVSKKDKRIKLVEFARNFGKEIATTAGFDYANGDAVMMVDADLQYPLEVIPEFLAEWEKGYKLVVGLRDEKKTVNLIEKLGSKLFYKIMNSISETPTVPGALDFRLLDKEVVEQFRTLKEKGRITRTLIDWLGYAPVYVKYTEKARFAGVASYSFVKRLNLAVNAFTSHSVAPLKAIGIVGFITSFVAGFFGLVMFFDRFVLSPRPFNFTGPAMLAVLNVFLIGLVLLALGLMSYYIAAIKREILARPMYIVKRTVNFHK